MKKVVSFLLVLAMCVTLATPFHAKAVQAAEETPVSMWAVADLMYGDTYGIYPLTWYEKGLTGTISQSELRSLYYGVRRKLVYSGGMDEVRFSKLLIDSAITVEEVLEVFYTLLTNYDYTNDLGFDAESDPVAYMKQIGVYTGQNGEQALEELCSKEQAMVIASRLITVVYDALDASSKGFLWEVKLGENTVYLLGSIHLASTDIYPFSYDIWRSYNSSDALVVEANLFDTEDMTALSNLMYYSDGTTLKDHVSAEAYEAAIQAAAVLGLSEMQAAYLKPWALYLTFETFSLSDTSDQTLSAQLGIDMHLLTNAVVYQKPIYAIEGLEKQGKMLDSFSAGLQEYLLMTYSTNVMNLANEATVELEEDAAQEDLDYLFECWKKGDVEAFLEIYTVEEEDDAFAVETSEEIQAYAEEYMNKFFTQRDDAMADYIDGLLRSEGNNTYFVVVGSLHYVSDYSVLDRLKEDGYVINQIK